MEAGKYDRSIALLCPTCGHNDFEREDGEIGPIRCTGCDRSFTREELIHENSEVIAAEVEEVKSEFIKDAQKEIRIMLQKAFKGSKNFRIK